MKYLIHIIAAARPNFVKIAPLWHALKKKDWATPVIVHTGQHYDVNMSDAFFKELELPPPDIHLGVGSGTHAEQTSQVMVSYEKALIEQRPDMVIVVGDVNSTIACALVASKAFYQNKQRPIIAHLEAGLRSFDRTMPEEINRLVTDVLADILWTPSPDGDENLLKEGIPKEKIVRVGNIMIDSLEMMREKIESPSLYKDAGYERGAYGVVTLHRPANVDDQETLENLCEALVKISDKTPLVFPVHPRTQKNLEKTGLINTINGKERLSLLEPLSYPQFMNLVFNCSFVITDSGGIQEETTYLNIPCLTLRPNTERPITVEQGTNQLIKIENLEDQINNILVGSVSKSSAPELWDGQTAGRVVTSIKEILINSNLTSDKADG
ncbi:UDP-N-acetylglucosamine 2-epimerase [hydrothermal vent metagenome]|uniref:UDP-N-acetylglucosamine 2-epimerase n=1 Tax=hydrothermal vent metagenome TaxID=652676 RepID=A0A3B1C0H5_9ZZZZ